MSNCPPPPPPPPITHGQGIIDTDQWIIGSFIHKTLFITFYTALLLLTTFIFIISVNTLVQFRLPP